MTRIIIFIAVVGLNACNNQSGYQKAEDAEDAGREFIRASLDGDYDKAFYYMLKDSTNTNKMILDKWRKDYNTLKQEEKVSYKDANILPINISKINDSVFNYVYSNTYEVKDTTTIKIVKINGEWLVDLKDIH